MEDGSAFGSPRDPPTRRWGAAGSTLSEPPGHGHQHGQLLVSEQQARLRRAFAPPFPTGAHFLLFTDELDEARVRATVDALARLAGPHGSAAHGDALLYSYLGPTFNRTGWDNFLVMQVAYAVFELAIGVRIGYRGSCLDGDLTRSGTSAGGDQQLSAKACARSGPLQLEGGVASHLEWTLSKRQEGASVR